MIAALFGAAAAGIAIDGWVGKAVSWTVLGIVLLVVVLRRELVARWYPHYVASGDIIEMHPFVMRTWEELCRDHNVRLRDSEQRAEMEAAFWMFSELRYDVERYDRYTREHQWDALLLHEARIRARLRAAVLQLRHRLGPEHDQAMDLGAGTPLTDVSDEDVHRELTVLRTEQDRQPRGDRPRHDGTGGPA